MSTSLTLLTTIAGGDFTRVFGSAGLITNPSTTSDFGDSGNLAAGVWGVRVIAGGSVAAIWELQRRNAGDTANVSPSPYDFYTPAGQSGEYIWTVEVVADESIRLRLQAGVTGTAAGQIQLAKLA